jgi:hypothetical protein
MTDREFMDLVSRRGIKLDMHPDLGAWAADPQKTKKIRTMFENLRNVADHAGRVHPLFFFSPNGRIMSRSPSLSTIPGDLLKGDFREVCPSAGEAVAYLKLKGYTADAKALMARGNVGDFLLGTFGFSRLDRNLAKITFFQAIYGMAPGSSPMAKGHPSLYREMLTRWPGLLGDKATVLKIQGLVGARIPLKVAREAEQVGNVVGFFHDTVLVECDVNTKDYLEVRANHYLEKWDPQTDTFEEDRHNPFPEGSAMADCYQWLIDCGGKMAMENNPMAQPLIDAGVARLGGVDYLGRRLIVLVTTA